MPIVRTRIMLEWIVTLVAAYALICALMYGLQRKLIYLPNTQIAAPESYGVVGFEDMRITTEDGVTLQAWYHPARTGMPTLIYLHGNAGNLSDRINAYKSYAQQGLGVMALSWRGYGKSEGSPSEEGLYKDARAAIAHLGNHAITPQRIVLYGESLGTGIAVQMATEYRVAALMLESPYTSVVNRSAELYPYLPARYMVRDRYETIEKIDKVKTPLLLLHGEKDRVIPIAHGRKVFERAHEPKKGLFYEQYGHVDFDVAMLVREVMTFLREQNVVN